MKDPHQPRKNTATNNRNYGFHAEAELLQWFRDQGFTAERLALTGKEDEGDFVIVTPNQLLQIVQLKTYAPRTRTGEERSPSMAQVQRWLKALAEQRKHYAKHRGLPVVPGGLLVMRARGTSWKDALCVQSMENWQQAQ